MESYEQNRKRSLCYAKKKRQRRRRTIQIIKRCVAVCLALIFIIVAITKISGLSKKGGNAQTVVKQAEQMGSGQKFVVSAPDYDVQLLTPNEYSRPQAALEKVKGIVIHYTANPGSSAQQNRNYFEGLKDSHDTKASSHLIVGTEGEIIQCIPTAEIAYASSERNADTISIECCHLEEDGKFTQATYDSLVHLTAWLCGKFDVPVAEVIRHYDVTGKACPLYYVEHEDEWEKFKKDVQHYIDENGIKS
ncbi:N-acetylmuramoyl-L-alanine amidase [Lachnospiraceae bacterium ZAX-1]